MYQFKRAALVSTVLLSAATAAQADESMFGQWLSEVSAVQASQPHWVTPLVTVTPRLEQEFRFDYLHQALSDGSRVDTYGNNKGLELIIPSANVELAINAPAYITHPDSTRKDGYADSSVLLKYRIASANEANGNYIVTAFIAGSFPTGSSGVGNRVQIYTPTLAVGKGFGDFDVQSTLSYSMPTSDEQRVGHASTWNTAFQYHVAKNFWPELEYNQTHYAGGPNSGKTQAFVTPGLVTKWPIKNRLAAVVGIGWQEPVTAYHTYSHEVVVTGRIAF